MTDLTDPTLNALRKRIMLDDNLWGNGKPRGEAINTIVAMIEEADIRNERDELRAVIERVRSAILQGGQTSAIRCRAALLVLDGGESQ